jgi:hypothetical protein
MSSHYNQSIFSEVSIQDSFQNIILEEYGCINPDNFHLRKTCEWQQICHDTNTTVATTMHNKYSSGKSAIYKKFSLYVIDCFRNRCFFKESSTSIFEKVYTEQKYRRFDK